MVTNDHVPMKYMKIDEKSEPIHASKRQSIRVAHGNVGGRKNRKMSGAW